MSTPTTPTLLKGTLTIEWQWNKEAGNRTLKAGHAEALEKRAVEQIVYALSRDPACTGGDLIDVLDQPFGDPDPGMDGDYVYRGNWSATLST